MQRCFYKDKISKNWSDAGATEKAKLFEQKEWSGLMMFSWISIDQVARLGLSQLVELGVNLVGHQKKIMNSIQAIRTQLSVNVSEGFLV